MSWLGILVQPQEWTPIDKCSANPSSYHTLFFRRVSGALLYIISKHRHQPKHNSFILYAFHRMGHAQSVVESSELNRLTLSFPS